MKKLVLFLVGCFCLFIPSVVKAAPITIYLFHGSTCPHCRAEIEYLDTIKQSNFNVTTTLYEVWYHPENDALKTNVQKTLGSTSIGVPFTVIGERYFTGFDENTKTDITNAITYYEQNPGEYRDVVADVLKNGAQEEEKVIETDTKQSEDLLYTVPILGEINGKEMDLISYGAIMGLLSSVHPYLLVFLLIVSFGMCHVEGEEDRFRYVAIVSITLAVIYVLMLCTFQDSALFSFLKGYQKFIPYLLLLSFIGFGWMQNQSWWKHCFQEKKSIVVVLFLALCLVGTLFFLGTKTSYITTMMTMMDLQNISLVDRMIDYLVFSVALAIGTLFIQVFLLLFHKLISNQKARKIVFACAILLLVGITIFMPSSFSTFFA